MKYIIAFFCLLLIPAPAHALKIAPFKASIPAENIAEGEVFRIENNSDEPAAVQVSAETWEIKEDGREENAPADDDIAVFPAQVVLKPHESRAIRVQYTGNTGAVEKSYRLIAEQLPVALQGTAEAGSAVRFLLKFKAALYITPKDAKSDIAVKRAAFAPDGKLDVTLENRGAAHAVMENPLLTLDLSSGGRITLDAAALKGLTGENIHAQSLRRFTVAPPPGLRGDVVGAVFTCQPAF